MTIFFDAPVEPDDLTAFVREVPTDAARTLLPLFPRRDVDDNKVDWSEITHTNRVAKFRAWDGRLHVSTRDTVGEKAVKLPPLSSSLNMGEYERLQLEFARTGGTRQEAYARAIYNDATNLTGEVLNRLEQAWGDVLTDGKLSINENGFISEADFGVPNTHIVNTLDSWANVGSADVLTELTAWHDVYVATNGRPAGQIRTSQKVTRLALRNAEVINAVKGSAAGVTMVSLTELNNLLSDHGLPQFGAPIDGQLNIDGADTRVIADDKLLFLPADMAELGYTAWGITATALELVNSVESDMSFEEAPGIVGVVEKVGPPYRQFTFVDACAMPVLTNPKLLMVADVIS